MKIPSSRRERGFTLVELLVVISIIAVLAAAGFAAGNAAIQKARKVTCLATCTAVESAVSNFFTEYGYMPKDNLTEDTPSGSALTTKNSGTGTIVLKELLGINTATGALNTRAVKFLNVKEGKASKNGVIYNTAGNDISGLYDPWGGGFKIVLDGNYDEQIKVKPSGSSAEKTLNGRRAACWSDGADAISGSGGKAGDDVITWTP